MSGNRFPALRIRIYALSSGCSAWPALRVTTIQTILFKVLTPVLNSLILVLLGTGFVSAAVIDDSSIFVEALTAYQNQDYQLAIRKISTLNQLFPETPLRDVTLLLLARAGFQSGNNELAEKSIRNFNKEYIGHPLNPDRNEELQQLKTRQQQGDQRTHTLPQRNASDTVVTNSGKPERETSRTIENHSDISAEIRLIDTIQVVEIGRMGSIPFQVFNHGTHDEEFALEANAPAEYKAHVTVNGITASGPTTVKIRKSDRISGTISYLMPPQYPDGHRGTISLRASAARFQHTVQSRDVPVVTAAPILRVVARPLTLMPAQGQQFQYRVTVLNVGNIPGRYLTARTILPDQIEFLHANGSLFSQESPNTITFKMDTLESGKLVEFTMNVRMRENSTIGQQLRSRLEIEYGQLQHTEYFTSLKTEVGVK
jgi:hypothetical protein